MINTPHSAIFFSGGEASREIDIDGEIRKRARPKSMAITGSPLKANGDVPKSNPSFFEVGSSPTNGSSQGTVQFDVQFFLFRC